jgi:polyisoprenoid-binding protein YceI
MTRLFHAVAAAFCLALVAACGDAPASTAAEVAKVPGAWVIDKAKSRIAFSGTQAGKDFRGEFKTFDVNVILDLEDLANASIEAEIDVASAKTGDRQRDDALPSADWFDARNFPKATFRSDKIIPTGREKYVAKGILSIRGVERPLDLPFTLPISGDTATAEAEATLMRGDFGVGQGEFTTDEWVGFEVKVAIYLVASR